MKLYFGKVMPLDPGIPDGVLRSLALTCPTSQGPYGGKVVVSFPLCLSEKEASVVV